MSANAERTLVCSAFARNEGNEDVARYFARDFAGHVAWDFAREVPKDFAQYVARYVERDFGRDVAREWGLDPSAPGVIDFATLEMASIGCAGARVHFASLRPIDSLPRAVTLLSTACRASLDEQPNSPELHRRLDTFQGDPLWPALARHLARVSDETESLTQAARNWDQYPEPLNLGLRYMAKGDILLQDLTTHLDMDDLAREAGVAPLPIVDPMEPELQVDWDAKTPTNAAG